MSSPDTQWIQEDSFDLITIQNPKAGKWALQGDMDPKSRITVVSDLTLQVSDFPNHLYAGESITPEIFLTQQDPLTHQKITIQHSDFLSILDIESQQVHLETHQTWHTWISRYSNNHRQIPSNGRYTLALSASLLPGDHQFTVTVDGKTFKRQFLHQFTVFPNPIQADVLTQATDQQVAVTINTDYLEPESIRLSALLSAPSGDQLHPSTIPQPDNSYIIPISNSQGPGLYQLTVFLDAKTLSGHETQIASTPLTIVYEEPVPNTPVPLKEPYLFDSEEDNDDSTEEAPIDDQLEPASTNPPPQLKHWLYVIIGFVMNICIAIAGLTIYRQAIKKTTTQQQTVSALSKNGNRFRSAHSSAPSHYQVKCQFND